MISPTKRQRAALDFIAEYQAARGGISPSLEEIAIGIGLSRHRGGVHKLLAGLEERGLIRRLKGRARAIEIVRAPARFQAFRFDDEEKVLVRVS